MFLKRALSVVAAVGATVVCLLILLPPESQAQKARSSGAMAIYGRWEGTSLCMDKANDPACKDEKIVYVFDTVKAPEGSIMLHAFKYAGKDLVLMGDLPLHYQDTLKQDTLRTWSVDFAGRLRFRWTYQLKDNRLSGTGVELPSLRLVRRVQAIRDSAR